MPNLEKEIFNHNYKTLQNSNKTTDDDITFAIVELKPVVS